MLANKNTPPGAPLEEDWRAFLARNFGARDRRRYILLKWLALKTTATEHVRLATVFEALLRAILMEPLDFHLRSDGFLLFGGDQYPVRFEWLSQEDQRFCYERLFLGRERAFGSCKEYNSQQIDYSAPLVNVSQLVDPLWRQQLARDFVWVAAGLRNATIWVELIAAVQWLHAAAKKGQERFLRDMLAGLQGVCDLRELVCIE